MAENREVGVDRADGSIRCILVAVRLTPAEKRELLELAKGKGISQFIREKVFGR